MSEAVLTSIDTGADLGADTGTGGTGSAGVDQTAVSAPPGTGHEGQRAAAAAAGADGTGADPKSASGGESQDGKDKLVPLAALHESREQIKTLRGKIAELEALPRLTEAQQKALEKLNAVEQAAVAKDPDFLEDPKGYVDSKLSQTKDALKKLDEANEHRAQQERAQAEVTQLVGAVSNKEQEFLKSTPDYYEAVTHIRTVRASQLQMLYPQATPEQITRQITLEEVGAARQILQGGGDPADFAYKYAKTVGYTPKAPAAASGSTSAAPKIDKDAVRSMGGGGGADSTDEGDDDGRTIPEFAAALAERFSRKRK